MRVNIKTLVWVPAPSSLVKGLAPRLKLCMAIDSDIPHPSHNSHLTPRHHPHLPTHTHSHTPPQSRKLQEAAKYLSELVGSYDPDTLYHACLKLAEVIKEGTIMSTLYNFLHVKKNCGLLLYDYQDEEIL